jgi:hypothetical protein
VLDHCIEVLAQDIVAHQRKFHAVGSCRFYFSP